MEINSINAILKIIKIFIRNYFIVFTANKLMSENSEKSLKQFLLMFVENIIITGCYIYIDDYYGIFYGTVWITLSAAIVLCINRKIDIGYSLILNIISIKQKKKVVDRMDEFLRYLAEYIKKWFD